MRLRIAFFVFILAVFSLSFISVSAQDGTSTLASLIDQRAAANGLPSGDGNISAAEQSLSSALIDEITGFDELVTGFEAESSANSAWVEAAEQAVQNFNQKITID